MKTLKIPENDVINCLYAICYLPVAICKAVYDLCKVDVNKCTSVLHSNV